MTDTGTMSDDLDLSPSPLTAHLTAAHHIVDASLRNLAHHAGVPIPYEAIEAHAHHMREVARTAADQQWPSPHPVCTTCGQDAHVTDADQPYCANHWPGRRPTLANPQRTRTPRALLDECDESTTCGSDLHLSTCLTH